MNIKSNNAGLEEALELLSRKTSEVYSDDGLVTIVFNGTGEYKSVRINGFLEDMDKASLEKAILSAIEKSKVKQSTDFMETIAREIEKENERIKENDEENEEGVTIDCVS